MHEVTRILLTFILNRYINNDDYQMIQLIKTNSTFTFTWECLFAMQIHPADESTASHHP